MSSGSVRSAAGLLLAAIVLTASQGPAAAAQANLTGHWKAALDLDAQIVSADITQAGSTATVCLPPPYGCLPGTVSDTGQLAVTTGQATIRAELRNSYLDGELVCEPGLCPFLTTESRILLARCACDDGNASDGDGCDSHCQIEPCFTCTGSPSDCSPQPDGTACTSGRACMGGETCRDGACSGGGPLSPCIDLTGHWLTRYVSFTTFTEQETVQQTGSTLWLSRLGFFGSIDPLTGAFDLTASSLTPQCAREGMLRTIHAVASADATSWTGTGQLTFPGPFSRCGIFPFEITATRCGGGTLDRGEECDDGNDRNGDGCSSRCKREGPIPTPTPSPLCPSAPRADCRQGASSSLLVRRGSQPAADIFLWTWQRGAATAPSDLGDPVSASTFYSLCVYGSVDDVPYVAMRMIVPPATAWPGGVSGWTACHPGRVRYRDVSGTADGIVKLQVDAGVDGQASIRIQGRGAALPVPFAASADSLFGTDPQVIAQLSNTDGACWEAVYPAKRTRATAALFKARH